VALYLIVVMQLCYFKDNKMNKLLTTAVLIMTTSTATIAMAHESCHIDFDGGVSINESSVAFNQHNKPLYKVVDDELLYVNGDVISLSSSQQALVTQYSKDIKAIVPKVKRVALEGVDLAVESLNLAFDELLGKGNDLGRDLTESLTEIRNEVDQNFNLAKGINIDEDGFSGDEILGDDFEARIESVMEDAVQNSIGTLLVDIGQEMLFSGGDMEAFETRMETFGQQIEHEMESRTEVLEVQVEALCADLQDIDQLENRLTAEIDELSEFNLLSANYDSHDKI